MLDEKVVILVPVALAEAKAAEGLFTYLRNGMTRDYDCVIAADLDLTTHDIWKLVRVARDVFADVQVVQPPFPPPKGMNWSNWMINAVVMRYSKRPKQQMVVFPPTSMPIRHGWLACMYSGEKRYWSFPVPFVRDVQHWARMATYRLPWYHRGITKGTLALKEGATIPEFLAQHPKIGIFAGPPIKQLLESMVQRRPQPKPEKQIVLRRWAAIGDVIASTGVAKKLFEAGHPVKMVTLGVCAEALLHSPYVVDVSDAGQHDIDLDLAYENHPQKAARHINDLYIESTNRQLASRGITLENVNYAPQLYATPVELEMAHRQMALYRRPWVVACPRSNMAARTVPAHVIGESAKQIEGTVFWCSDCPAPAGTVDLKVNKIRNLMAYISMADLVLSVDSGPLHIAAGLKKPIVAIRQSFDPDLRISDQRDFTTIERIMDCLPCNQYMCRHNKEAPPCGLLDPGMISEAVMRKLTGIFGGTVSAIIPVYKPDIQRLNRCLTAILPQVDQVVIGIDGGFLDRSPIIRSPKIKFVTHFSKTRRGYGKTCNLAARESFGRFLLMLNDDCYAHPEMVRHLLFEMQNEQTAVVGGLLRYPDGRIQHGGTTRHGMGFGHIDHLARETTIKAPRDMEWVTFAAAMVRRDAFYQVDAFDERFDCYSEDSDICLRLGRAGWKVRYTPHASGIHQESMTTSPMKAELLRKGQETFQKIWTGKL